MWLEKFIWLCYHILFLPYASPLLGNMIAYTILLKPWAIVLFALSNSALKLQCNDFLGHIVS